MIVKISNLEKFLQRAANPRSRCWRLISAGRIHGDALHIEKSDYIAITREFRNRRDHDSEHRREPTVADMATNAGYAAWRAAQALLRGDALLVGADIYAARADACNACEYWDASARLGLGKCKHAKCGCTKFKRWMATEKCPLGKWEPAPVDNPTK